MHYRILYESILSITFPFRHYYCHVGSTNYIDMDFSHENYHEVMILGQPKTVHFQSENTFINLVTKMTSYLGRQPMLPDWTNDGAIIGVQGGTEKVRNFCFRLKGKCVLKSFPLVCKMRNS